MLLDITKEGRVFLRRDLSKYRHVHAPNKDMKIIYDKRPSERELNDAERLIEMVRAVFTSNKERIAA